MTKAEMMNIRESETIMKNGHLIAFTSDGKVGMQYWIYRDVIYSMAISSMMTPWHSSRNIANNPPDERRTATGRNALVGVAGSRRSVSS